MPYIDRDAFIKQQRELYCKDCTRRMGVKNGKLKEIYKIGEAPCKSCELNDALDSLDDYPEADVAPIVHAHWILICKGKNENTFRNYTFRYMYKCSDCGRFERIYTEEPIQKISDFYPYCHCGAKMDKEMEGEK